MNPVSNIERSSSGEIEEGQMVYDGEEDQSK
jgi:hypothetical protein